MPPCLRASLLLVMLPRWVNFDTVPTDEVFGHSLIDARCFEGKTTTRKPAILRSFPYDVLWTHTSTIPNSSRRALVGLIHIEMRHPPQALPPFRLGTRAR